MKSDDHSPEAAWELVARSQAGDRDAFGQLYDQHVDHVYAFVWHKVGERLAAEELTAATFFTALADIGTLQAGGITPRAWLIGLADKAVRAYPSSPAARVPADGTAPDLSTWGGTNRGSLPGRDSIMIGGLTRQLPPDQQRCLTLHYVDGYDLAEIAQLMGLSMKAVAVLHHRAIRRLQELVDINESTAGNGTSIPRPPAQRSRRTRSRHH